MLDGRTMSIGEGKRILVTGAAGFIGAHLVRRLLSEGYEVIGVDNLNNYYDPRLKDARLRRLCMGPQFWFVPLDLADREGTEKLFRDSGFEFVVHLAAQAGVRYSISNPDEYVASNLIAFVNMLDGVRACGCHHFVFASSSSVYGASNSLPFHEEDVTDRPVSLYAATKKSNEVLAHAYSHLYNIPTTGLRFFTVYGPWGRPDMAIFKFVDSILRGHAIEMYNFGQMRRDFTFVDDVVEGIIRVLALPPSLTKSFVSNTPAPMRLCNIGNQKPVELLHVVRIIERCLGRQADIRLLPMQAGDVYQTQACVDRLKQLAGYTPRFSIEEGLEKFVTWYLTEYLPLGLEEQQTLEPLPVKADYKDIASAVRGA
jgi:UDP-glucuronate 4-epimerase